MVVKKSARRPSKKNVARHVVKKTSASTSPTRATAKKIATQTKPQKPAPKKTVQKAVVKPDEVDHLILSYKAPDDPTPEKMAWVKATVQKNSTAQILHERPGLLQISVSKTEKENTRQALKALREWNISEEGHASMF